MTISGIYLTLSIIGALGVLAALIQARRLSHALVPYFLLAWLTGELAFIHLAWQVALTVVVAMLGGLYSETGQWGLFIYALSWLGLLHLHRQSMDAAPVLQNALREALGADYRVDIPRERQQHLRDSIDSDQWLRPFRMRREGVKVHTNISYGEHGIRNQLDIYQPAQPREGGFPILLQVHGGGWMIGEKQQQALPLMYHLAQRGWLCIACNYRLSPKDTFPAHIIDVKQTIAWIREHASRYGGNPDFLAITGGSAGGHLSSLAALTPNQAEWQPGFEDADTSVDAAVPFYGVYDFLDRDNLRGSMSMQPLLSKHVMKSSPQAQRDEWEAASPISHVNASAPPMFVVQGLHDSLVWVEEARSFVTKLREVSSEAVAYAELPGAQHAFEVFHSVRTDNTVNAVSDFLEWCYARQQQGQA
jgi:acetyl esterase/lipase